MNDNYVCTDKEHNRGVVLNEYNGDYSIVSANEDKAGKIWMDFGFKNVNGRDVKLPLAGKLGNKKQAADILRTMLAMLGEQGQANYEGDVPF